MTFFHEISQFFYRYTQKKSAPNFDKDTFRFDIYITLSGGYFSPDTV